MSETIWADVLDKMYDLVIAETYIAAEIAAERLKVFDGPPVNQYDEDTILTIGGLPVQTEGEPETTSEWNWAAMGVNGTLADVDDAFSVPCGIHTVLGEANLRTARRAAIAVFAKVAALYRGPALSVALAGIGHVLWSIPQMNSLRQSYTADGAECLIIFSVHVRTRI